MAIVVESTASNTAATGNLTITKPSGLAVGDLFIAVLSASTSNTITNPAGWTVAASQTNTRVLWKIATSGDVAASNFTFTYGGSTFAGALLRCSGFALGNEVDSADSDFESGTLSTSITFPTTISPALDGSLLIMALEAHNGNAGAASTSGYFVTGSSLTWTELFDYGVDAGVLDPVVAGAYAIQTTKSALTAYGATTSVSKEDSIGALVAFKPAVNASGTNALHAVSPTIFSQAGVAGVVGTNDLLEVSPDIFDQSGKVMDKTRWTNLPKASTDWTNPDK